MELRIVDKSLGSKTGSNGNGNGNGNGNSKRRNAPGSYERGELIHFTQLAKEQACKLEFEKSTRELTLQINRTQEAERQQISMRLHEVLAKYLATEPKLGKYTPATEPEHATIPEDAPTLPAPTPQA